MTSKVNQNIASLIIEADLAASNANAGHDEEDVLLVILEAQVAQAKALVAIAHILQMWRLESKEADNADLLAALEALVTEPSDDWRDATDDDDGHTRTPRQRVLKQARAAIAKSKTETRR